MKTINRDATILNELYQFIPTGNESNPKGIIFNLYKMNSLKYFIYVLTSEYLIEKCEHVKEGVGKIPEFKYTSHSVA